jgi:PAS domain S-box-containing protein
MDAALNSAPCGFVTFDDDGTLIEVNNPLCDMVRYSRVELLGWHVEKILPAGGRIFYHTHLFPLLKLKGRVEEIYLALRSRDGADIPVLLNGVRQEVDGQNRYVCVIVRMIQRHQYEEQLLAARRLAEEANAAKAKFLSMVSHDLRTPLTTISGNAALLLAGALGTLTPQQIEGVETIKGASGVLASMLNDILDFAQLESGRVKVRSTQVTVMQALARAEALMRSQMADASLHFSLEGCDSNAAVLADPTKLQQILLNLLTNAIKFTPAGGSVTLRCRTGRDRVLIEVQDSGIGIAPDDCAKIFQPFIQLEQNEVGGVALASHKGVGLGLAISKELAEAMDGSLSVQSVPGEGSRFIIDLPAVSATLV